MTKSILSTVLVSLVAVSMVACDGNQTKQRDGQVTLTTEIINQSTLDGLKEDLRVQKANRNNLLLQSEQTHMEVLNSQKALDEAINSKEGTLLEQLSEITRAKEALEAAKKADNEIKFEIAAVDANIFDINSNIELIDAKLTLKTLKANMSKLADKNEKDNQALLINKYENKVEKLEETIDSLNQ